MPAKETDQYASTVYSQRSLHFSKESWQKGRVIFCSPRLKAHVCHCLNLRIPYSEKSTQFPVLIIMKKSHD